VLRVDMVVNIKDCYFFEQQGILIGGLPMEIQWFLGMDVRQMVYEVIQPKCLMMKLEGQMGMNDPFE
jgi:hypothetical protein